jgi:hypothetical protein
MEDKETAMMQMLEFIHTLGENYESKMHAVLCQEKAIELLELEKEQLKDAYEDGDENGRLVEWGYERISSELFYNETYGK